MSSGKVFLGVLAGVAAGALLGVLFAPEKGSDTRKNISKKSRDYTDSLKEKFSEFMENVSEKFSFEKELLNNKIVFFGSGSEKWKPICNQKNALFKSVSISPESLSTISNTLFSEKKFTDLAYSEPFYLKEFQSVT